MTCARLGGPYRYTREGRGVFHLPLARPWTWALTHHGMWSVFVQDVEPARAGVPERRHSVLPPDAVLGCWLAIYATREYDAAAVEWLRKAHGLEAPAGDVLPAGCYVAVARLAEVSTVGNDSRAFGRDAWWWPCGVESRGTVAWWLEEVQVFEPLPAAPAQRLAPVDVGLLPELRERARLARNGIWRPEVYPVPAELPVVAPGREEPPAPPVPPARSPPVVDDRPVPPMLHVEQLGLFGMAATVDRPAPAAPPGPAPEALPPVLQDEPVEDLRAVAEHLRALLADGDWHPLAEVHAAVGLERVYRVTCWGGSPRPPDAHQVPVALRGDGQGSCWYAAWPGG
ncbi:hypothetical protein [Pyxidicoccus caerfyrddinensis]|uniref:hypothetical protein n=1 Tax=Pyxidicoccus caerfyrddinensis TaxID=2709663 RepID=UPI001F08021D|nr:hypothetical protein [Pyxidicoccus caerfyrddinensis]